MTDPEIRLKQKDRLIRGYKNRIKYYGKKLFAKRRESTKNIPTKDLIKIIIKRWQQNIRHH